jgi:hypothetical protein
MAALAVLWAFRLASTPGQSWPTLAWSAAVLLGLHPILGDLSHGNVNIFIAFLVMGGWELFRRRQDTASGFLFGLAVACKVTPALLFPYLVWKRAWRAAAAMLISVAVWLCVVPGAVFGWERNTTLLTHWFDGMVRPFLIEGRITSEHANQSIPGVVARLLTSQPSDWDYDEDGKPVPVSFHTIVDLGSDGAKRVVRACQVLFALAVVTLCWAPIGPGAIRQGPRFAAEVSLILLGMLLFSERTWKHHAVTLILPYAVMAGVIASGAVAPVWRRYLTGTCLVTAVCTFGPSLIGGDMQDLALVYGSQTVVFLLLAVAMGVVMHHVDSSGGTNRTDHHQAAA